jgi:tRNA pseudouridine38-40 synthase
MEVASRTDRGVSARANALALRSELAAPSLLSRLNSISPELWFTAAAPVSPEFRVRRATRRIYRYFDPLEVSALATYAEAASTVQGRIDVRSFGRGIPPAEPCWRVVEAIEVWPTPDGVTVEVRAPSFVWGMVRKVVGAVREVDRGRLSLARLRAALSGEVRLTLPMAEPEGLVLWDVEYPVEWVAHWRGPNRHQEGFVRTSREGTRRRKALLDALFGAGETSPSLPDATREPSRSGPA